MGGPEGFPSLVLELSVTIPERSRRWAWGSGPSHLCCPWPSTFSSCVCAHNFLPFQGD